MKLASLFASVVALAACAEDPERSLLAIARDRPALTTLVDAVQFASVDDDLVRVLDSPGAATWFAPDNAAFDALAGELSGSPLATAADLFTEANRAALRSVLRYHILPTTVETALVPYGKPIVSSEGSVLKIDRGPVITDGRYRKSHITEADVGGINGVVHVIDRVLLPADRTIAQTAQHSYDFTLLVQTAAASGLVPMLDGVGPYTVFAPTNTAFAALLTELRVTKAELLADTALLTRVLTYHVVAGLVLEADVPIGLPITTVEGGTLQVDPTLVITDGRGRRVPIIETDTLATNGVIHIVDRVLLPAR